MTLVEQSATEASDVLERLRAATLNFEYLRDERERLIQEALREGFSERRIGKAAGVSGPAIHNRKIHHAA